MATKKRANEKRKKALPPGEPPIIVTGGGGRRVLDRDRSFITVEFDDENGVHRIFKVKHNGNGILGVATVIEGKTPNETKTQIVDFSGFSDYTLSLSFRSNTSFSGKSHSSSGPRRGKDAGKGRGANKQKK